MMSLAFHLILFILISLLKVVLVCWSDIKNHWKSVSVPFVCLFLFFAEISFGLLRV